MGQNAHWGQIFTMGCKTAQEGQIVMMGEQIAFGIKLNDIFRNNLFMIVVYL